MNLTPVELQLIADFRRIRTEWRQDFALLSMQSLANSDIDARPKVLHVVRPSGEFGTMPKRKQAARQPALALVGSAS